MKGNSRVRVMIFFDGLSISRPDRFCPPVADLQQKIMSTLQKSFIEPIISDLGDILLVPSGRPLDIIRASDFNPFVRVTFLLLKEEEYLNWDVLAQLDKEAIVAVILEWLQTIGVRSKTMVLFQWQQADQVNISSTVSDTERNYYNYVEPALLIAAGSML